MRQGLLVLGLLLCLQGQAEAAFTPRDWAKGAVNVVAGVLVATDEVVEGLWDIFHDDLLHPLGNWGKGVVTGIVTIGESGESTL